MAVETGAEQEQELPLPLKLSLTKNELVDRLDLLSQKLNEIDQVRMEWGWGGWLLDD
jgi:hypothetical protein